MSDSLGEQYPKEQARCREALEIYKSLGPLGMFGAANIEMTLQKADKAVISGDLVAMIEAFQEMQEVKL